MHEWGDPIALLKFTGLSPIEKLRYGLMMFMATRRQTAGALERLSAKDGSSPGADAGSTTPCRLPSRRPQILTSSTDNISSRLALDADQAHRHIAKIIVP